MIFIIPLFGLNHESVNKIYIYLLMNIFFKKIQVSFFFFCRINLIRNENLSRRHPKWEDTTRAMCPHLIAKPN